MLTTRTRYGVVELELDFDVKDALDNQIDKAFAT